MYANLQEVDTQIYRYEVVTCDPCCSMHVELK